MKARRYQLTKDAVAVVRRGHPWIFRDQLSSAAQIFKDGDLLRLVDGANQVVAHGLFESEGAIAIRIVRRGPDKPDAKWLSTTLEAAVAKRAPLLDRTNAMRLVHGESDGIPAVVADKYGDTIVVTSYSAGSDAYARFVSRALSGASVFDRGKIVRPISEARAADMPAADSPADMPAADSPADMPAADSPADMPAADSPADMPAADSPADMPAADSPADMPAADSRAADMPAADSRAAEVPPADARVHTTSVFEPGKIVRPISANIILESPQRRRGEAMPTRVLFGSSPGVVQFVEDGITFAVDIAAGQKTGTFLDLRGLRRAIATMDLADKSVLNLFAYTGMLGRCAEAAGATTIVQVDQSQRALDFAREHHVIDPAKHQFIVDDIFERMPTGDFDLVIVDPPAMTSRKSQVPKVLAAYRKLYRAARERVRPGGLLVAACCTSRIERAAFHRVVRDTTAFAMERELPAEVDHPVGFKEADYLKIALWRRPA